MSDVLTGGALILLAGMAVLTYVGYGLSLFLLPRSQRPLALAWAPMLGYSALAIGFHILNVYAMDGRGSLIAIVGLATCLNIAAVLHFRAKQPVTWRLLLPLATAVVGVYWIGLAPLFGLGHLTAVSKNWDVIDIYDATASYVIDYPVRSIAADAPPNPLERMVMSRSTLSNGWGFSYFHATTSIVSRRSPVETQAPSMSLMHALLIPASFLFLVRIFRFGPRLAFVCSCLLGVHPLLLWTLFQGFGNQTAMISLLPVVFATTFAAVEKPTARAVLLAGIILATIPLTYWITLAFYLAAIAVHSVALVFFQRGRVMGTLGVIPAILLISAGLAFEGYLRTPPIEHILATRLPLAQRIPGLTTMRLHVFDVTDVNHFVDSAVISGMKYWTWPAPEFPVPLSRPRARALLEGFEQGLWLMSIAVVLYECWRLRRDSGAIISSIGITSVVAVLVLRTQGAFYGYLKGFAFVAWWYLPLAVAGMVELWNSFPRLRQTMTPPWRGVWLVTTAVAALIFGFNSALTVWFYTSREQSALRGSVMPESSLQLASLSDVLPENAPVFIGGNPPLDPGVVSAVAFYLQRHALFGHIRTAESELDREPPPGCTIAHAILPPNQDPAAQGYPAATLLWSNNTIAVYQAGGSEGAGCPDAHIT